MRDQLEESSEDTTSTTITYKVRGTDGEIEVANLIPCPNCNNQLMTLPQSYPMYDLQCKACNFRAQIKTSSSNPNTNKKIRGAGWDIMDKVLKAGYLIPSLIVNYKWTENSINKQEIRFYPFIRKTNLKKRIANIKSHNRIYNMFDYDLTGVVYLVLFNR